jgi:hypothetical protein
MFSTMEVIGATVVTTLIFFPGAPGFGSSFLPQAETTQRQHRVSNIARICCIDPLPFLKAAEQRSGLILPKTLHVFKTRAA